MLSLLGKSGEPRPGRAVSVSIKHVAVVYEVNTTLETDEAGRIELGALPGVERVTASLPSGSQQVWSLWPQTGAPRSFHALAGDTVVVPAPPGIAQAELATWLALTELRDGSPRLDVTDHVTVDAGALVLSRPRRRHLPAGLPRPAAVDRDRDRAGAGDHRVGLVDQRPPAGRAVAAGAAGPRPRSSTAITWSSGSRRRGRRPASTWSRPASAPIWRCRATCSARPVPPGIVALEPVPAHYVSGRDIGDEYRYVLERRTAPRRPGTLLDKPSLLLNPWALRTTSSAVQHAAMGGAYGASPARAAAPAPRPQPMPVTVAHDSAAFVSLDFLAAPAVVIANLRPDAHGLIRVPRGELGAAQLVRVTVVDPALTSSAELALAENDAAHRDLRLRRALDAARHFAEDRRVSGAAAGTTLVVDDVRSGKLELVDTVARAHQVLLTLGGDATLREFAFVAQWHTLDDATRRSRYSKYACHELHLFLHAKDPEFFTRVVRPYLTSKRHDFDAAMWPALRHRLRIASRQSSRAAGFAAATPRTSTGRPADNLPRSARPGPTRVPPSAPAAPACAHSRF